MNMRLVAIGVTTAFLALGCGKKADEKQAGNESAGGTPAQERGKAGAEQSDAPKMAKPAEVKATPARSELPADSSEHKGAHQWSTSLGGITKDSGRTVAIGPKDMAAVAGYFSTTAKLGAAELEVKETSDPEVTDEVDAFVAVFDAAGKPAWTRQLGGKGEQIVSSVAFDSQGNVVVAGWFGIELDFGEGRLTTAGGDDIFVAKFDPTGRRLWAKRFGGPDVDGADALAIDAGGNIVVTGVFRGEAEFAGTKIKSSGNADAYVLKLNPAGEVVMLKPFGERYDDFGRAVAIDSQSNMLIFGEFSNKVSFGGQALESVGNRDLFITKLDPTGGHLWSIGFGTELDELGLSIATDPTDSVVITGSFEDKMSFGGDTFRAQGKGDVFVAKYDRDGKHVWSKQFGGKDEDIAADITTDGFGNIYVTGWFWFTIDFGGGPLKSNGKRDSFLVKLSPAGDHLWSKTFGNKESDTGRSVAVASDGSVLASGSFRYTLDMEGEKLAYAAKKGGLIPYADIYLARFSR